MSALHAAGQGGADLITMDFQDVDLRQVVRFMAEVTGKNYVVDQRVKGQVSVITPQGVTLAEAQQIFETVLTVHGFSVTEIEGVHKVIPAPDSKTDAGVITKGLNRVPKGEKAVIRLVKMRHADANALVAFLRPFSHPWGLVAAHPPTNALIIADTNSTVRKILEILVELDIAPERAVRKLIPLHHAQVAKIEKIANGIFADYNSRQLKGSVQVKIFADTRTNTVIVLAPKGMIEDVSRVIMDLDRKTPMGSGNLHMYYPKNAKAEDIAKVLNELLGKVKGGQEQNQPIEFLKQVSIVHETKTNALVIAATPEDYELLIQMIEGMDIRRLQVYVEALLVEMSSERAAELGVEWRVMDSDLMIGSDFGGLANPLSLGTGFSVGVLGELESPSTVSSDGTLVSGVTYKGLGALVKALEKDSDTNILSTPTLVTMDREEAVIVDGENIPIQTGVTATGGTGTTASYERRDVGIQLKITPHILNEGRLQLNIYQEQSNSLTTTTSSEGLDKIAKRSIQTKVVLNNRQTIVLGGLVKEQADETVNRVPCLGSISGLGEVFKDTDRKKKKTVMMVFLRPVIINTYQDLVDLSESKYNNIHKAWGEWSGTGSKYIPEFQPDALPIFELAPSEDQQ